MRLSMAEAYAVAQCTEAVLAHFFKLNPAVVANPLMVAPVAAPAADEDSFHAIYCSHILYKYSLSLERQAMLQCSAILK